ncbi:MAG TPA: amino acid adenylation domain-containing protein, partial [bacterium]
PESACIHELFEAQVERTPEAVAVTFEDQSLTYRQLNRRANQLAHQLQSLGVGPEALVGICVERSLETVEGLLGILKAGGAYVPLDPEYPRERLAFMVRDSGLRVLLTQTHLSAKLSEFQLPLVCLDSDRRAIAQQSLENCHSGIEPGNLAYVIYTSGSTGRPKGVEITHRSLVSFLAAMQADPGLTAGDTLLAVTTISFDIAALELFFPLSVGARVVLVSRDTARDGRRLLEELARSGATCLQATPTTWRLLVGAGWQGNKDLKILCGGEALPRDLANELVRKSRSIWNMYGPTETTIWSTLYRVRSGEGPVLIGRPIANTETHVLDNQLQPVPVGVAGELYIGGAGVARGYRIRPELTAEKFIPNQFSKKPGARLYKTGDRARYRPDGNIEFLGRLDDQVKIRGFRIELGELEAVLGSHPGVREAVVIAREDVPGEQRLAGYLVAAKKPAPSLNELYSFSKDRLPEYMIPDLVVLDSLPRTPNGKVDRRALPAPGPARPEPEETFVGPRTPAEEAVADIWTRVLGVGQVSRYDNFFDLGGHSLLAMQVVARIEGQLGVRINLKELMFQTLAQLAAACEERAHARMLSSGSPGSARHLPERKSAG